MRKSTTPVSEITFAGIDYHKRFIMVALGDRQGNLIRHEKLFNADQAAIVNFFRQYPGIVCAIETCRGFEWLLDLLSEQGITVRVAHARLLKLIAQSTIKTDKIDSATIMNLLAKDFLPTVHFPSKEQQQLKERLRWRVHIMRNCTRLKLRIHALIDKENKGHVVEDLFSVRGRKYLQTVDLPPVRRDLLDKHLDLLDELESRLDVEVKWLKQLVNRDERAKLLLTVPGIGHITAATFMAEIGELSRFQRAEQVSKYFGLVPSLHASADTEVYGRITKEGNSTMRWLMVEAAWKAIQQSPALKQMYLRISLRRGKHGPKIAIVAVARKLVETAFNVLKHGKPFSETRVAVDQLAACTDGKTVV